MHIRGPTWLKQLAVYVPSKSHDQRGAGAKVHNRHHSHLYLHQRNLHERKLVARAVGDIVTATIDGQLVSWTNVYDGHSEATPSAAEPVPAISNTAVSENEKTTPLPVPGKTATPINIHTSSVDADKSSNEPGHSWTRQAYYSAADGISDGFTFLNHFGGMTGIPGTANGGIP